MGFRLEIKIIGTIIQFQSCVLIWGISQNKLGKMRLNLKFLFLILTCFVTQREKGTREHEFTERQDTWVGPDQEKSKLPGSGA